MVNIIVNAGLVSNVVSKALAATGDFRVTELPSAKSAEVLESVRTNHADMLLMHVALHPDRATLEERLRLIHQTRKQDPQCKIVLLMDTNIGDAKLKSAVALKQAGLIDSFLYADCSPQFLAATLQSMLLG